jgi:malonate transporter
MDRLIVLAIPFFGPIVIGYVAGRLMKRPPEALGWLNFFVLYVSLPPVFFQLISKTPFDQLTNLPFVFGAAFSSYTAFALAMLAAYLLNGRKVRDAVVAGGIGGYGNVGYMGPGLALAVLGPQVAAPMALIFTFDCILFFTIIPLILALNEEKANLVETVRRIAERVLLNPFIIATFIGVAAAYLQVRVPEAVDRGLTFLMNAAAPSALFALGVTVALRPFGAIPRDILAALAVKLLLHPAIVLAMLSILGAFDPNWVYCAVLMACLPPALSVFVMASQYDTYVESASTAVLVGTALSFPTVLFWLYLIEHQLLPPDLFP